MKIAFVCTDVIEPLSAKFSMSILVCNIASRLARQHEVIVYSPKGYLQEDIEHVDRVEYRHKETTIDKRIGYVVYGLNKRIPEFFHASTKAQSSGDIRNSPVPRARWKCSSTSVK